VRPGFAHVPRPHGRNLSGAQLENFVNELAGRPELWIDLVKHDHTQRVYEELFSDAYVTAWLICWMEDQDTGFHDHDISSGAVAVVSGRVLEERLALDESSSSAVFKAGGSFHFSPGDIHRVRHAGEDPAVTLHVYSPPLLSMGAYAIGDDGRMVRRTIPSSEELRPPEAAASATATRLLSDSPAVN
jgi:predicted metal-dependent enzyme (double-stranded beta helix superfamily)